MRATIAFAGLCSLVAFVACSSDEAPPSGSNNNNTVDPPGNGSSSGTPAPPGTNNPKPPDPGPNPTEPTKPWEDDPNAPPCTSVPGEIYDLKVRQLAGTKDIPMCRFKGYVALILNGASHCGQTYQYEPLQVLYDKYATQKFIVLAFPSDSFDQEEDTSAGVSKECIDKFKLEFPLFSIGNVAKDKPKAGDVPQPVFNWLITQPQPTYAANDPRSKDPLFSKQVPWNFEKFLISRDGKLVRRFNYTTSPWPTWDTRPTAQPHASPASEGGNGTTNVVDDAILVELAK